MDLEFNLTVVKQSGMTKKTYCYRKTISGSTFVPPPNFDIEFAENSDQKARFIQNEAPVWNGSNLVSYSCFLDLSAVSGASADGVVDAFINNGFSLLS